jgi:hypothetical protein
MYEEHQLKCGRYRQKSLLLRYLVLAVASFCNPKIRVNRYRGDKVYTIISSLWIFRCNFRSQRSSRIYSTTLRGSLEQSL